MVVNAKPEIAPDLPWLVGDIGGTWIRLALVDDLEEPRPRSVGVDPVGSHATVAEAVRAYLARSDVEVAGATLAVASPVVGDQITLTNSHWSFSRTELRDELDLPVLHVVNDFAALAQAIPILGANETRVLHVGAPRPEPAPQLVIGPGTGLGVSFLLPSRGRWVSVEGEGGHRDLGALNEKEWKVLQALQAEFGHVSAERVLSGSGLENLHRALHGSHETASLAVAEIVSRAREGVPECVDTTRMFSAWLGTIAGDAALTLGTLGGVYLGGGVLEKMGSAFDEEVFLRRFMEKGRFQNYLERIPIHLILDSVAALRGASMWLQRQL